MSAPVLIVDDDPDVREMLQSVLERHGYRVIVARHGRDALEQTGASGARPAIILLDLNMPVMDGEAFLAAQAAEPLLANVPVVVLSAERQPPASVPANVRAVLAKPATIEVLLHLIRTEGIVPPLPPPTLAKGTGNLPPLPDPGDVPGDS